MKNESRFLKTTAVLSLTAVMAFTPVGGTAIDAYAKTYTGSNEDSQDYYWNWSEVINSYLLITENGLVRVQAGAINGKLLVENYNDNYKVESTTSVSLELPLFGSVATDGENYYVLTGKKNTECSDSAEVYRITKYNSEWKKLGSDSLYGANTTVPFEAGSARMVVDGDDLYVRTCHKMYSGHQANVTMKFDTNSMKISKSYTEVAFSPTGYVSHSFNQFLGIDGDSFIGIDHGDAYERAICLNKCKSDFDAVNDGYFWFDSDYGTYVSLMDIPGNVGDNYTGVEIGGFGISKSTYIVAGNKVDDFNDKKSARNVFVTYVDKDLQSKPTVVKLTNYKKSDTNVSTPQMVQISSDRFIVLWESSGIVNYVLIDGKGNKKTKIYQMKGSLSDCQPIVYNGYVTWYTWKDSVVVFNRIETAHVSKTSAKIAQGVETLQDFSNITRFDEGTYTTIDSYYKNGKLAALETKIYDDSYNIIQKVKYSISGSNLKVTKVETSKASVTIPKTVTYGSKKYKVTQIGENAFKGTCSKLKTITVPGTITNISSKAFTGLRKAMKLNIKSNKANYSKIKKLLDKTNLSDKATIKNVSTSSL
ncbi:MAG: leucine-rich repeat domain-containing protein [Lachnospiraceae bacterium]|nr:leucine-rich repeat domain-containing protein [Lachnospiraceae bacterium]